MLDADYYSAESRRGVIFLHGACEQRLHEEHFVAAAEMFAEQGLHALMFDFRGHGKSEGNSLTDFRISLLLYDVAAACRFLRERGVERIGLAGASVGGAVATLYAGAHAGEIGALGLLNPVLDFHTALFEPVTERTRAFFTQAHQTLENEESYTVPWNGFQLGRAVFAELRAEPERYDPGRALCAYSGPICVLHGDQDEDIAHSETERVLAFCGRSDVLITIPDGKHTFPDPLHRDMVVKKLADFFLTHL